MSPTLSRQTVGVIGSGTLEYDEQATAVGALLSDLGVNLLTGGGRGVMRSASRGFVGRRHGPGICIGIIPCDSEENRATPKPGYPNEFVELPIYTHLPYSGDLGTHDLSRNHINILSCAAIVSLPGEDGTISEAALALRYRKPIVLFTPSQDIVRRFPAAVPRVHRLEDVAQFLARHLHLNEG